MWHEERGQNSIHDVKERLESARWFGGLEFKKNGDRRGMKMAVADPFPACLPRLIYPVLASLLHALRAWRGQVR